MAPSSCTLPPTLCCVRNIREVGFGSGQLLLANRRRCGQFLPNPTGFGISGSGFADLAFLKTPHPAVGWQKLQRMLLSFVVVVLATTVLLYREHTQNPHAHRARQSTPIAGNMSVATVRKQTC